MARRALLLLLLVTYSLTDDLDLETTTVRTRAGSPVTLACPGLGQTPFVVSLTWLCRVCAAAGAGGAASPLLEYRDGRARPPGARGGESPAAAEPPHLRLDDATFALVIGRARATDTGLYFCLVNSRQQPKGAVRLEVKDVPSAPGRPMILGFSSRTANISWTQPRRTNFAPVLHYVIHVRETERGPWDRSLRTAGNVTRFHVTGLRPYTVYSFRVTALNEVGSGPPSETSFPVQTLREAPSGHVRDLTAVSRGPTSVQLTWQQAEEGTLHGEFLGYQLTYRSPETGANRSLVITEQNVTTLVVTGLQPYTEYLFSLTIRNPRGQGPAARATCHTQQSVPGPPASVRYTSVGSTWTVLMWTPPTERNGVLLRYLVNVSSAGRPDDIREVPVSEENWIQYQVDRLNPFTYYNIGVSAETAVGRGLERFVRLRTDTDAPGMPRILGIRCVRRGATQLRWLGPPTGAAPPVSFFTVGYRNERDKKYHLRRTPAALGEHTLIIRNLDKGMTYFKIQAGRKSRYRRSAVYKGPFTEPWSALLPGPRSDCSEFRLIHPAESDSALAVGIGIVAGIAVLALVCTLILCSRRQTRRGRPAKTVAAHPDWRSETIPAQMFAGYVRDLQRGADAGFWKEMSAIDGATAPTNGHHAGNGTNGANGHHAGTNGCTKQAAGAGGTGTVLVEGYNGTYVLQDDDRSPHFWEVVRRHKVDTIVRFGRIKDQGETGDTGSDWPAPAQGCEVQHKPGPDGSLSLLIPASGPLKHVACCDCVGGGRRQVRYVQLDGGSPAAEVRDFLQRSQHCPADRRHTLLVVTRGAEQSAALLVAADALTRQWRASGEVSPVAWLTHLRRARPAWFTDVAQVKQLYGVLSEAMRTDGAAEA